MRRISFIVLFLFIVSFNIFGKTNEKKIDWKSVTPHEFIGQDVDNNYTLNLYNDLADSKVDKNRIQTIRQSSFDGIADYFIAANCIVGKIVIKSKATGKTTQMLLFLSGKDLFEATVD